ncbi:hypothetical protein [Streptomyces sp. NPDC007172]|uniref:hypothetical protein n=1 Tax=Streptomyces sp. NPDC007172 TaxID=3364776 RepID=UPI003693ABE2
MPKIPESRAARAALADVAGAVRSKDPAREHRARAAYLRITANDLRAEAKRRDARADRLHPLDDAGTADEILSAMHDTT